MRAKWLNFILKLTNRIYSIKQTIISQEGTKVISGVLLLFFYELGLAVVSLPLYLSTRTAKVTAFLEEKGGYEKISYDYNLRRVLTLSGVGVVLLVWLVKLSLIVLTPNVYGPLQLYKVSNLEPADLLSKELVIAETQIQTASIVETMKKPVITNVEKAKGGDYIFYGTGQPNSLVVLFLAGEQTVIYTEKISKNGIWEIRYNRNDFVLSEGNHAIVAFSYNEERGERSQVSDQQYFKVNTTLMDRLVDNIDIYLNITIIIIIALGIFLMILTI